MPISRRDLNLIMLGLMLTLFLGALDQTIVSTALPTIVADLKGATHLSWVVTAYLLTSTASTPLYGKVGDLYGRKKVFLIAISIFLLGSVLCGLAQNMLTLILFRAVQGLGTGGIFSLTLAIIADVVPLKERAKYQGIFGAVFGVSSVIGPLLGGTLTQDLSWRWVFYVNLPLGALALFLVITFLHLEKRTSPHKVDYLGSLLVAGATTSLLLALVWGGGSAKPVFTGFPWTSPAEFLLFGAFIILTAAFLFQEHHHPEPLLPLHLFKIRSFTISVLLSFVVGASMFGAIVFIPQFQQIVRGYSPTKSGLLMIPLTLGIIIASVSSGRYISRTGRYRIFPIAGTIIAALGFLLLTTLHVHTSQLILSLYLLLLGLGVGSLVQITVLIGQSSVELRYLGTASSATVFFRTLGGALGTSVFGAVLNASLRSSAKSTPGAAPNLERLSHSYIATLPSAASSHIYSIFTHGLDLVFLTALPFMLVGIILAVALPHIPLRQGGPSTE